jgi:hypothetical protein
MAWNIADCCVRARQALRSRYLRLLEDEVARERAEVTRLLLENRAV